MHKSTISTNIHISRSSRHKSYYPIIAGPLTIACLYCCIVLASAASFSSNDFTEYVYDYQTLITSGPTGFKFTAKAHLELIYNAANTGDTQTNSVPTSATVGGGGFCSSDGCDQFFRLRLTQPVFYPAGQSQPLVIDRKHENLYNPDQHIYAHIQTISNGTAHIKQLYTHQADSTTFKNLKKSILINLLPTNHHISPLSPPVVFTDDNNNAQPELFSPDSISRVNIVAKPRNPINKWAPESTTTIGKASAETASLKGPIVFQSIEGYQNVTFRSRVFEQAESNLTTTFQLKLVNELKSSAHEKFDQAESVQGAIELLDKQSYQADSVELQRERRICSTHHCGRTLAQLFKDHEDHLTSESLASVEAAVTVLRILDKLRHSKGTGVNDIMAILKRSKGDIGVMRSFLDILAAARTKDSIMAALKHLKLAKISEKNSDTAERFLAVLSVSAKTASKMHLRRALQSPYYFTPTSALKRNKAAREQQSQMASLEYIAQEFLRVLQQDRWLSQKLRWSTLLTLATLVDANNAENKFENTEDELNEKVSKLLLDELQSCQESSTDCRVVVLQAIGNVGHLKDEQFQALKEHVLSSGRRESISAMKVLRDLLQHQAKDKPMTQGFYSNLKDLLLRVVYDNSKETTARVLAAELIVRFVPSSLASEQLLHHLPSFGNNELATMIYSRIHQHRPGSLGKHRGNWYWESCIINGSSTVMVRNMAETDSMNASYGVNVERLNKGILPKDISFDVFLDTRQRTQDLFSLGLSARGLSNLFGGGGGSSSDGTDGGEDENESTMAGMTLRLLGGYLRPYVFFETFKELQWHVLRGKGSDPTTVFNGNMLLIDHEEGYPLISGFVAEQQMRGVLSIDVTGAVKVSLWYMNAHSVVSTKASVIVQASQSVLTGYDNFWHSHLFSFGGQAMIDVLIDAAASSPFKFCLQVTQPEFLVRHNSRRHNQMMTKEVRRKITRRNYSIDAKSYKLNEEINKMCSMMKEEL